MQSPTFGTFFRKVQKSWVSLRQIPFQLRPQSKSTKKKQKTVHKYKVYKDEWH